MFKILLTPLLLSFCFIAFAQKKTKKSVSDTTTITINDEPRDKYSMRIMFYNVENLFDTINDTNKNDEDFLPDGNLRWNGYRYNKKLKNTYKVITAVGGWDVPEVIGFCEIENRLVLEELISKTPLRNSNYEIIHYEAPDERGIDVGLIYRPDKFAPLAHEPLNISFENDKDFKTRDILYVKGIVMNSDTLHLFVNHWPSRRGGETDSEPKRLLAASIARNKIDEILKLNTKANILLMGDFNDYPENRSMNEILRGKELQEATIQGDLVNLMFEHLKDHQGSHKYQRHWGCLDQIVVSPYMLKENYSLQVKGNKAHIYRNDFLLKEDERWMGIKPFRTYEGFKYVGGYSDHLPVFVDLIYKEL
jgi:predicted extracellular nuclease